MEERTTDIRAAERRLERARAELKLAMNRPAAARRTSLYGDHNPEALDEAVLACRDAQAKVRQARLELEREWWSAAEVPAPEPVADDTAPVESEERPLEITPRLLFARWLVQTGRLTD